MQAFSTIASHVPVWVWTLLALLLALGLRQSRDQYLPRGRLVLLPLIWLAYGLWGVRSSFGHEFALMLAWALGLVLGMQLMRLSGLASLVAGSHFDAQRGHYFVPGSWLPMVLMLALFGAKFALGMSLAMHPELAQEANVALSFSALFGALSGALLGRSRTILRSSSTASTATNSAIAASPQGQVLPA
ncbi:DUF6622 family protein [Roseateles sp. PN1]|uniref:DUF6622 family protein n=1 Tax=Roseateles sp. PN1 TaxID=3137372 RepID=UPI003139B75C